MRIRSTFESLLDGVPNVTNVLLLVGGAYRVRAGEMTVGEVASFVYLFTLLVFPLRLIGFALSELPHSIAGWNRIREVLDQPVERDPATIAAARRHQRGRPRRRRTSATSATRPVLRGITAEIPAGRMVAVVGATGAGKSTLLRHDRRPRRRRHRVDHRAVVGMPARVPGAVPARRHGAGEHHDGRHDRRRRRSTGRCTSPRRRSSPTCPTASTPRSASAASGCRAGSASGSPSRARWCATRAVLLLDDTTSALDPTTEAKVLANLRRELAGTTVIAVASRPSTIALADDVLYLADGVVVAHGRHEQLMAEVPGYRRSSRRSSTTVPTLVADVEWSTTTSSTRSTRDRADGALERRPHDQPRRAGGAGAALGLRRHAGVGDGQRRRSRRHPDPHPAGDRPRLRAERRARQLRHQAGHRRAGGDRGRHHLPADGRRPPRPAQRGGAVHPAGAPVRAHPPPEHRRPQRRAEGRARRPRHRRRRDPGPVLRLGRAGLDARRHADAHRRLRDARLRLGCWRSSPSSSPRRSASC